jgi:hypothetical protein
VHSEHGGLLGSVGTGDADTCGEARRGEQSPAGTDVRSGSRIVTVVTLKPLVSNRQPDRPPCSKEDIRHSASAA